MNQFLDFITNFIEITGNSTIDSIILSIIGVISFLVAFGIVGIIFDSLGYYDSDLMSGTHWIIRIAVFLGLSFVSIEIAKLIKWLFSFQWWVYLIFVTVFIGVIILFYYLKYKYSKNKRLKQEVLSKENETNNEIKTITIENYPNKVENKKDCCPRCGGLLVKRHGPYGDFYGCDNFSKTGCRYTRKFK